jgi:hypothetical protein
MREYEESSRWKTDYKTRCDYKLRKQINARKTAIEGIFYHRPEIFLSVPLPY